MLVLSRKQNEVITIGDDITLTVVEIRGGRVKLGIQAPADYGIHRAEMLDEAEDQRLKRISLLRRAAG